MLNKVKMLYKSAVKKANEKIYELVTKLYINMSNKRHLNLCPNTEVLSDYRDTTVGLFNPIECIYFAIREVYDKSTILLISGVSVEYTDVIKVNIYTARPGLIIGLRGRCIDALGDKLTKYFGRKIEIKLHEVKTPVWLGPFYY